MTRSWNKYPLLPVVLPEEGSVITLPDRAFRYVLLECDKGAEITSLRLMWHCGR